MNISEYKKNISAEEIEKLPTFSYEGDVTVIDRVELVEDAVKHLSSCKWLGFDTETKPSFRKGVIHSVGLLQLASEENVYLFCLNKIGLPVSLGALLADEKILKIGVGIRDDLLGLRKLHHFVPVSFLDLQIFVKAFGIEESSFSKLMAILFEVKISKRQRTSNWEAPVLTSSQIRYAATDAWGALQIYKSLRTSRKQRIPTR